MVFHMTNHVLLYPLFKDMLNLNKLDFTTLEVSGRNCQKWVQDVKLHLTAKSIRATIEEPTDNAPVDEAYCYDLHSKTYP